MNFGWHTSEEDSFKIMDRALELGINFFDTARIYGGGKSEEIMGRAFKGRRDKVILATKFGMGVPADEAGGSRRHLLRSIETSLSALQTDYIDLYQLHWPERDTNFFGKLGYTPAEHDDYTPVAETLEAVNGLVQAGKIRYLGLSNETPWGIMHFLQVAGQLGLPRVVSVQNPYSLLNRSYEIGAAEVSWREQCGLLAYSPLGFGVLSGKYLDGARPAGGRLTLFPDYMRYSSPAAEQATARYVELARSHGLEPSQMALAIVNSRPFLTSTIIGATTMAQLRSNIDSIELDLSAEVLDGIQSIHEAHPNPSP